MKHILLITIAFFFGLSSFADHEGKIKEEVTWDGIYPHVTPEMEEAFHLYMAKEKKNSYHMQALGVAYYSRGLFKAIGFPQDYWKAVKWKMHYIESGACPLQGVYSLWFLLEKDLWNYSNYYYSDFEKDLWGYSNHRGRPDDVSLKEVAVLLYAMEIMRFKKLLYELPYGLKERMDEKNQGISIIEDFNKRITELESKMTFEELRDAYLEVQRLENKVGFERLENIENINKRITELESKMTFEELRDAYLEVQRLENLVGDALYDERVCGREDYPWEKDREDYPWEKETKDALEFYLREGHVDYQNQKY